MRGTGRPGRGERGRVAARVRELLGGPDAAEPDGWTPDRWPPGGAVPDGSVTDGAVTDGAVPDGAVPDGAVPDGAVPDRPHRRVPVRLVRWIPDRRAAIGLGLAVLAAGGLSLWWVLSARPRELAVHSTDPVPAAVGRSGPTLTASSLPRLSSLPPAAPTAPAEVVIDVAGRVHRPGVYRLATGSRVVDAVRAAGGVLPGVSTTALNLAAPLTDGQQVIVGVPGTTGTGGGPAVAMASADPASAPGSTAGVVDLNAATLEQLQTLPGVGPVLAQHILDWRTQHGHFTRIEQLNDVSGIGDVKFAELRSRVSV